LQLGTDRLLLRPLAAGDAPGLLNVFGDPKVMAAFGEPPFGEAEMQRWLQRRLDQWATHGYGLFAVVLKESGRLIGDCGLEHLQIEGEDVVELGYDIASACWNRGLATEAATAVLAFAFRELNLPEVVSLIRTGNAGSRRVAEKAGLAFRGDITHEGIAYWLLGLSVSPGTASA
jgi:RimJ/RimL family protein N-acetyltransferase